MRRFRIRGQYGLPVGVITGTMAWDDSMRLLEECDGKDNCTRYTYNALNQRVRVDYADGTFETTEYDHHGNIVRTVDANGTVVVSSYDGLDGLLSPMTGLVPVGDPVPFPDRPFNGGQTRPLKLRMLCGGVNLRGGQIAPPEIVGLSEATRGPIDITTISLNDGANPQDPFFSFNEKTQQWNFSLRTTDLAKGAYTLKIRVAERKDYPGNRPIRNFG